MPGVADLSLLRSRDPGHTTRQRPMAKNFERHRQPWTPSETSKLHLLVGKGHSLKAIATSLSRTEESVKKQAKAEKLKITKMR